MRLHGPGLRPHWSPDGQRLFLSFSSGGTYVVPLPPGRPFPEIPEGGFESEAQVAQIPGVQRVVDSPDMASGLTPDVYAFARETVQRNLYRVPVP